MTDNDGEDNLVALPVNDNRWNVWGCFSWFALAVVALVLGAAVYGLFELVYWLTGRIA